MKMNMIIGIGILLLVSGCITGKVVEEKITIPISGAPYSYQDLTSITLRFPMKMVTDRELSKIGDKVLEKTVPEIRTFTGKKYVKFEPVLQLVREEENLVGFSFEGRGYVDNINFDEYEIFVDYDKERGKVEFDQKSVGWWGIPTKYKIISEEVARKERGLNKKEWPLNFLIWNPEKQGQTDLRFKTEFVTVDLENRKVVE